MKRPPRQTYRFGDFDLDVSAYELRRQGRRVRLERRPMDLLIMMVERRGELILRGEIIERLWGKDVFIEIDTAVNTLVRKIRQALRDSSGAPTFVETVPGKGYRFIAPVEISTDPPPAADELAHDRLEIEPGLVTVPATGEKGAWKSRGRLFALVVIALLGATAMGTWVWKATRPGVTNVTLAVLPFQALNLDPARAYLADALHEETIAALGQIDPERIHVVTRRSTLEYRQTTKPLSQIARELKADYIVESSIVAENGHIRVTTKLIRARDEQEIWNRSYDDQPRSMLEFQTYLAAWLAGEIRQRLSPEGLAELKRRSTDNPEAYDLYLQGLYAWNQLKPPLTTELAIRHYSRAIQVDPGFALPWAGLALAYAGAPINGDADARIVGPEARRTANRAWAANPRPAEVQTAMGAVKFWLDWDWSAAADRFGSAVAANPTYAFGRRMLGIVRSHQAHHAEAGEHMRQLLVLEPDYEMNWALRAQVAYNARQFPEAVEAAKQGKAFAPDFWIADYQLAMAFEQLGKTEDALLTLEKWVASGRANSKMAALKGYILAKTGREGEAREVLQTLEVVAPRQRYVPPYARALVHAGLGERDAALRWLERAFDERDVHLIALPTDPKWDPLRADARFTALLSRCGFAVSTSPPVR